MAGLSPVTFTHREPAFANYTYYAVPPNHDGSYGINHYDNNTVVNGDEHIWVITTVGSYDGHLVYNIVNTGDNTHFTQGWINTTDYRVNIIPSPSGPGWIIKPFDSTMIINSTSSNTYGNLDTMYFNESGPPYSASIDDDKWNWEFVPFVQGSGPFNNGSSVAIVF